MQDGQLLGETNLSKQKAFSVPREWRGEIKFVSIRFSKNKKLTNEHSV